MRIQGRIIAERGEPPLDRSAQSRLGLGPSTARSTRAGVHNDRGYQFADGREFHWVLCYLQMDCQFHHGVTVAVKSTGMPLLDTSNVNHGLLLPIPLHYRDDPGQPLLRPPQRGRETRRAYSTGRRGHPPVLDADPLRARPLSPQTWELIPVTLKDQKIETDKRPPRHVARFILNCSVHGYPCRRYCQRNAGSRAPLVVKGRPSPTRTKRGKRYRARLLAVRKRSRRMLSDP